MRLTTKEQECLTHRLKMPDTIWDFIQNAAAAEDLTPLTEGGVDDACESLVQKLGATIVIEDLPTLQMWLLMHSIESATWHLYDQPRSCVAVLERCAAKVETLLLLTPGTLDVPPKLRPPHPGA